MGICDKCGERLIKDMTETPTYTVATDFDGIKQLREVIDALAAGDSSKRAT
jgi:hypothetical protein